MSPFVQPFSKIQKHSPSIFPNKIWSIWVSNRSSLQAVKPGTKCHHIRDLYPLCRLQTIHFNRKTPHNEYVPELETSHCETQNPLSWPRTYCIFRGLRRISADSFLTRERRWSKGHRLDMEGKQELDFEGRETIQPIERILSPWYQKELKKAKRKITSCLGWFF